MIVITGATGNVGTPLVRALAESGEPVTAVSRNPASLPAGVTHRPADLTEPESLRQVLDGANALFLLIAGENPHGILDVAEACGVRQVVLLSSQGVGTRPDSFEHPRTFEDAVRNSGLQWTILRSGGLDSNALAWAETIRTHRSVHAPFGDVALPFVDPLDIAEVAATVLREPRRSGEILQLTGPAPITPRRRARAIGDALGTPVQFHEQSRQEAREQMRQFMPESIVEATLAVIGEPIESEQRVSPDVERLLRRPARAFGEWAERNVAEFR